MSVVRVGLLGLGTVGSGVVKTIRLQEKKLTERLGKKVEIVKALVRDRDKIRRVDVDSELLTTDFQDVLDAGVDVLVEVIGGLEPAYQYIRQGIEHGCHIVTANKELLAKRGQELIQLANQHRVHLAYEASVAGGIPILGVLRQFLRTNEVTAVQGILNGTTNYILSQMEQHSRSYADVLEEAQQLGYAEQDPTSDVEGYDPLYKLYILSQLVYGESASLESIEREGISQISTISIRFAKELGYRFKLLAKAVKHNGTLRLSVRPTLLSPEHPLARLDGACNGIQVTGNIVGDLLFTGEGAGELPTASAVVEDLAFLLTQPHHPQPLWRDRAGWNATTGHAGEKGDWFLYVEDENPELAPNQLFDYLQQKGIRIHKQRTEYSKGEILRAGLVLEDASLADLDDFKREVSAHVKVYPILRGSEHVELDSNSAEVQMAI